MVRASGADQVPATAGAGGPVDTRRSMTATILIGIGIMAAVDEIIFHQLLAWHHFFDRSTPAIGLLSDGLLHSAELIIIVVGFFMFANLHRRHALAPLQAWAGLFLGLGGFQLLDGLVSHKLLRIHQIRYVENVLPYDVAWNVFALLLLAVGMMLAVRSRRQARTG
jgi:uncharacterized membrane protein